MGNWNDIETAPRDGTWILVSDGEHGICTAQFTDGDWYDGIGDRSLLLEEVTHWMPLPKLPGAP